MRSFFHLHIGKAVGVGFYVIALFNYCSYENRPVLGLWSYPYFILIAVSVALLLVTLANIWRYSKRGQCQTKLFYSASTYFDLGILFWGLAYFLSTIDLSTNASRIADLNIFGSIAPAAVILEWLVMVLLFIAGAVFIGPKLAKRWKNPMLMVITIGIIILLSEGIIRIKAIIAPFPQGFPTYTSALWQRYYTKFNSEGFRDVEHSLDKPSGTHRILIVGDSFAFGWGIKHINDRLGEQIAGNLTERLENRWEAINASQGDSHTLDHIKFLKQTLPFNPDIVILLYVFNDIDYLSAVTPRSDLPFFSIRSILYKNLYLFQEMYFRLRLLKIRFQEDSGNNPDPYEDSTLVLRHLEDISKFVEIAEMGGASVWVVPFDIAVVSEDKRLARYERFVSQAKGLEIPVLPIDPEYNGFQFSQLVVNKFDAHPNERANRIAAEGVAKIIIDEISNQPKYHF